MTILIIIGLWRWCYWSLQEIVALFEWQEEEEEKEEGCGLLIFSLLAYYGVLGSLRVFVECLLYLVGR